jgi:hypothetical protein
MRLCAAAFVGCALAAFGGRAVAQESSVPEEVRALSILCSSGASVKFRGEIEGGLNRLFGKIIAGTGDLEISENETDFLNSFQDENLKLEARRVYNECALGALEIVYNKRENDSFATSDVSIVVPEAISEIPTGNRFALQSGGSVMLEKGGLFVVEGPYTNDETKPVVAMSNAGRSTSTVPELGTAMAVPESRSCHVTYYHRRNSGSGEEIVYSFLYDCNGQ